VQVGHVSGARFYCGVTKNRTARTARGALSGRVTKYRTARTASRKTAPRTENNYRTAPRNDIRLRNENIIQSDATKYVNIAVNNNQ